MLKGSKDKAFQFNQLPISDYHRNGNSFIKFGSRSVKDGLKK